MKKFSQLKITLLSLLATSLMAGCASELPLALNSTELANQNGFQTNAFEVTGMGPGHQAGMERGQHPRFGFDHGFGADLALSAEQKTQLQALEEESREYREANQPEAGPQDVKALIDTAFLSDSFDVAALKAELTKNQPDKSAIAKFEAEMLIKRYQILTNEQKATLKAKQAERASQFEDLELKRPDNLKDSFVDKLSQALNLNPEQVSALKAVQEDNRPAPEDRATQRTAIQSELEKANPSAEILAELLIQGHPGNNLDRKLTELKALHGILNAEQRQEFVDLESQMGHGPHQRMGFGKMGMRGKIQPPVY